MIPVAPPWYADAACKGTQNDVDWWNPGHDASNAWARQALRICARCPVKQQCYDAGYDGLEYGVWGGVVHGDHRGVAVEPPPVETHCHNGHPWADNYSIATTGDRSFRRCRTCTREANRRSDQKRRYAS